MKRVNINNDERLNFIIFFQFESLELLNKNGY